MKPMTMTAKQLGKPNIGYQAGVLTFTMGFISQNENNFHISIIEMNQVKYNFRKTKSASLFYNWPKLDFPSEPKIVPHHET